MSNKTFLVALSAEQIEFLQNAAKDLDRMLASEAAVSDVAQRLVNRRAIENFRAIRDSIAEPITPSIVLGMEGDWVQGATANMPMDVVLIDHDRDESDSDRAREINVMVSARGVQDLLENEGLSDAANNTLNRPRA